MNFLIRKISNIAWSIFFIIFTVLLIVSLIILVFALLFVLKNVVFGNMTLSKCFDYFKGLAAGQAGQVSSWMLALKYKISH